SSFDLDAPAREGHTPFDVVDLARCLVHDLREAQPSGPYLLGGYSFGGGVAFEMARQLAALGEPIGLLALIDTYGPNFPVPLSRLARERRHWQRMRPLSPVGKAGYLAGRLRGAIRRMSPSLGGSNGRGWAPDSGTPDDTEA